MDAKAVLGIVAALVIAGVSGGLAVYRDVGVLRADVLAQTELHKADVEDINRDLGLRDLRERGMRDSLIRLEERHQALAAGKCAP
jgi:hypothetical protein